MGANPEAIALGVNGGACADPRASSITARRTALEARCAPYNGRIGVESDVFGKRSISDALTDCVIAVPSAGTFSVVGAVTWSPELRAGNVSFEVRKAGPVE